MVRVGVQGNGELNHQELVAQVRDCGEVYYVIEGTVDIVVEEAGRVALRDAVIDTRKLNIDKLVNVVLGDRELTDGIDIGVAVENDALDNRFQNREGVRLVAHRIQGDCGVRDREGVGQVEDVGAVFAEVVEDDRGVIQVRDGVQGNRGVSDREGVAQELGVGFVIVVDVDYGQGIGLVVEDRQRQGIVQDIGVGLVRNGREVDRFGDVQGVSQVEDIDGVFAEELSDREGVGQV